MEHFKFFNDKQAKTFYDYKNTKEKHLKINTAIWNSILCTS
jgi:hypothetical protein